jgi:Dickkopf N-terminal cysteine-rich region
MAWSSGEIIAVVVIIIIFVVIVGLLIWWLLVRKPTTPATTFCSSNSECGSGFYCGGGGICVKGTSGKTIGQTCTADHQCDVGLLCENGKCLTEITVLSNTSSSNDFASRVGLSDTPVTSSYVNSSFGTSQKHHTHNSYDSEDEVIKGCGDGRCGDRTDLRSGYIVTYVSGTRYYLEVTSNGSRWVTTPTNKFEYDNQNQRLTSDGQDVEILTNGNLALSRRYTSLVVSRRSSNSYVMMDRFGNVLSVSTTGPDFETFFPDPLRYPNSNTSGSLPVMFEIK